MPDLLDPDFLVCIKVAYEFREVPPEEVTGVLESCHVEIVSGLLDQRHEAVVLLRLVLVSKDAGHHFLLNESLALAK